MILRTLMALLVSAFFLSHAKAGNHSAAVNAVPNGYQVVYGSNGTPTIRLSPPSVSGGATTGEALIKEMFKAPGPGGKTIDVTGTRKIPWKAVAGAASKALPWVAAGAAIKEIWDSIRAKPDGDGMVQDKGTGEVQASVFRCNDPDNVNNYRESLTALSACSSLASSKNGAYVDGIYTVTVSYSVTSCNPDGSGCYVNKTSSYRFTSSGQSASSPSTVGLYWSVSRVNSMVCPNGGVKGRDGKCPTYVYEPVTEEELSDKIEEYADKTRAPDVVRELVENDTPIPGQEPATLTGPPKVESEPRVKTETDAQGNTQTTTTRDVYNITYQGNTYTWNTTTITNNPDGSKTEETDPEPEKVTPAIDPELPELPTLYERKYPNGLVGVWNSKSAELAQAPIFQFLESLRPNVGDAGCPVWNFPSAEVLGISVGGDISVPCHVWAFLRVFFSICALMLARRLIFGG